MTTARFSGLLLTLSILTACSSGRTALRQGDFDAAVTQSANRLVHKPDQPKASVVLQQAFVRAYEQHQQTIRQLSRSTDPFRWEAVFAEYTTLETLTKQALRVPGDWLTAYPANYVDRMRETRQLAATARYEAAEAAFCYRKTDRLAAKDAYLNFRKAGDWVLNFRDAQAKADTAFPYAVLRVVIEPMTPSRAVATGLPGVAEPDWPGPGASGATLAVCAFMPVAPMPGDTMPVHQVVQMTVVDYDAGVMHHTSSSRTVESTETYKVGEKKINDSTKVDIREKVKGTLTTYTRKMEGGMRLKIRALDNYDGRVLWDESISESRTFADEWFSFSGDTRALNGQSPKTTPVTPPAAWDWLRSMSDELAGDIAGRLHNKYAQ